MTNKHKWLILLSFSVLLTGCGKKEPSNTTVSLPATKVETQTVATSRAAESTLEFPGTIVAENETKLIAKTSGNLQGADFKVGDKIRVGQIIATIDDVNGAGLQSAFNATQIKQAAVAVNQAEANYQLAAKNFENQVMASGKDLRQAEIARDQAATGKSNLNLTTQEAVKSAELALETAKTTVQAAEANLINRQKQLKQTESDANTNTASAADAISAACGSILTSTNGAGGYDTNNTINISYEGTLGALDSAALDKAKNAYRSAKDSYNRFEADTTSNLETKISKAQTVAEHCKSLADAHKNLMEKTVSSSFLPQTSLLALQSAAAGYAREANGLVSQANSLKQNLVNISLNTDTTTDSLQKALELAKKQEAQAAQALKSLKTGNTSQLDQAGLAFNAAANNFDNLKIKINTQLTASKTQADVARMQYENAQIALQALYDNRQIVSAINGFVTKKLISSGDVVSAGQAIATVSTTDKTKVQFFVNEETLSQITIGQNISIRTGDKIIKAVINAISPQADSATKRYLIEAKPEKNDPSLKLGSIISVELKVKFQAIAQNGALILPLEAISIGQNENYIFVAENGQAKKVVVELASVTGEYGAIKPKETLSAETKLIIKGARLLADGQKISE